jgi:hypothetical protein
MARRDRVPPERRLLRRRELQPADKWSKDGKLLAKKDTIGTGPGEFGNLHTVAVDAKQRVFISDWGRTAGQTQQEAMNAGEDKGRIQIFDANLNYLAEWPHLPRVGSIQFSTDQRYAWATDDTYNKVIQLDLATGRMLSSWGTLGARPGNLWGPHDLSRRQRGQSLYSRDLQRPRAEVPRAGGGPREPACRAAVQGAFEVIRPDSGLGIRDSDSGLGIRSGFEQVGCEAATGPPLRRRSPRKPR